VRRQGEAVALDELGGGHARAVYTLRQVEASEIAIKGNFEKMQQRVTYQIRS
jgi:hypothetical protein